MLPTHRPRGPIVRLRPAAALVVGVLVAGTAGYRIFGMSWLDAAYQTVTTVTTVGFRELKVFSPAEKVFTLALIGVGVGTVLYTFTLVVQVVVEGEVGRALGRRRMDKQILGLAGHVIVCGLGRVGRGVVADLAGAAMPVVVVDSNPERAAGVEAPAVVGDATQDSTLRAAGIERARALVTALADDADNLFVTLSGRAINPRLFIVARARAEGSIAKLKQAGADRVVNPQELGAARMASFVVRPHVAEFVDVVMHERSMDFRMQEVEVTSDSSLVGRSLTEANLRERANVLVLALRLADGEFLTNPDPEIRIEPGQVLIAVGTDPDLARLVEACR